MKKKNQIQLCEVLDLSKVKKKCPQVIKECEICGGTIIDNDNVPEEFIVDYNDRQIYSAVHYCAKCGAEICENCLITIDGAWEQIDICSDCYDKHKKRIDRIIKLQKRAQALEEDIADEIEEFLNDH